MSTPSLRLLRETMIGSVWILAGKGVTIPILLVTTAFLTRALQPAGYGVFILVTTLVLWVEWMIMSLSSRTTVKFVSESEDWRSIGVAMLRLNFGIGVAAAGVGWLSAPVIAGLLDEPTLTPYLRLFVIDVPIFALVQTQYQILVGIGRLRLWSVSFAVRWTVRLVLIVLLIEFGWSIEGALWGTIGASAAEWAVGFTSLRLTLFHRSDFPIGRLWAYAVPLSLFAISTLLFTRLDLFLLKALGGTTAQAGVYGIAQGLSYAPGMLTVFVSSVLQSMLGRLMRLGYEPAMKKTGRQAMRAVVVLTPFVALAAGAAPEIVEGIAGSPFLSAAPIFVALLIGVIARLMSSVSITMLTAAEKPFWSMAVSIPILPLAVIGHIICIPYMGGLGAALVTATLSVSGAFTLMAAVHRVWGILPPGMTCLRSLLIGGQAYGLAAWWPTPGFPVFIKLSAGSLLIGLLFFASGEISKKEFALMKSILRRQYASGTQSDRG